MDNVNVFSTLSLLVNVSFLDKSVAIQIPHDAELNQIPYAGQKLLPIGV